MISFNSVIVVDSLRWEWCAEKNHEVHNLSAQSGKTLIMKEYGQVTSTNNMGHHKLQSVCNTFPMAQKGQRLCECCFVVPFLPLCAVRYLFFSHSPQMSCEEQERADTEQGIFYCLSSICTASNTKEDWIELQSTRLFFVALYQPSYCKGPWRHWVSKARKSCTHTSTYLDLSSVQRCRNLLIPWFSRSFPIENNTFH